jgi:hypothetical protein
LLSATTSKVILAQPPSRLRTHQARRLYRPRKGHPGTLGAHRADLVARRGEASAALREGRRWYGDEVLSGTAGRSSGFPVACIVPTGLSKAESEASGGGVSSTQAAGGRVAASSAQLAAVESRVAESASVQDRGSQQTFGYKIVKTADLGLRAGDVRVAAQA